MRAIAAHIASLPKVNSARPRTVIITQGAEPVIVVTGADRQAGLRIRIHFIRIRIQHFRLNSNPGSGSRALLTKNWKKITPEKKINFFFKSKTAIYLSLGLHKVHPSYRRSLQLSKEVIQHFRT